MRLAINNQTDSFWLAFKAISSFRKLQHMSHGSSVTSRTCVRYTHEHEIDESEFSGWKGPYEKR